ncbi:MAG: hypothetical protein QME58_02825 [Bacteroidota bacterium]|nr:hypothetical protein [Bacteroidota bacterium]
MATYDFSNKGISIFYKDILENQSLKDDVIKQLRESLVSFIENNFRLSDQQRQLI